MIQFDNLSEEAPYLVFKNKYDESFDAQQKTIEAISISSYSHENKEVNSRFVNLKLINDKEFIFFSNYESPKSKEFTKHNQISALIYWNSTNTQIRMKASINRTHKDFNQAYFTQRDEKKNALAICSNQSQPINSYDSLIEKYEKSLKSDNLRKCPDYWGGFSFIPYYFEFWEGHNSRLNKREVYKFQNDEWIHSFLQA